MKLGIIGIGHFAKAAIDGFDGKYELLLSSRRAGEYKGTTISTNNMHVAQEADAILLFVRPNVMPELLDEIKDVVKDKLVITFAAGLPISFYEKYDLKKVVRILTNLAIEFRIGSGTYTTNCSSQDEEQALEILQSITSTHKMETDHLVDVACSLSGCGIAYFIRLMDVFIQKGVSMGLTQEQAQAIVLETVKGSIKQMETSSKSNTELVKAIATPGGVTEQGLNVMDEYKIEEILGNAIENAVNKCTELAKKYD